MKLTAIMVDIDGTLAHMNGRRKPYEWHLVGGDDVDETIASITNKYDRVIVMSGRDEVCRAETQAWLAKHSINYDKLVMRPLNDNRKDSIVKWELYEKHVKPFWDIEFVLDDRQQVVDMWRENGLKCLQVSEGAF